MGSYTFIAIDIDGTLLNSKKEILLKTKKDIKKAKDILWRIIDEDADVKQDDTKRVYVDSLGASEVVLGLRVYCENAKYWELRWRLLETIKITFDKEGIEIPYQKLDVHILKEENS